MTFGELVKDKRKKRGISQRKLAEMCQLTQATVCKIEKSSVVPNKKTIIILSLVLYISPETLKSMGFNIAAKDIEMFTKVFPNIGEEKKEYLIFKDKKVFLEDLDVVDLQIISLIVDKYA